MLTTQATPENVVRPLAQAVQELQGVYVMPDEPSRHAGARPVEGAPQLPLGRSLITVVGIDAYSHHKPLTNAVNDAQGVLGLLKRCGFEELAGARSLFNEQATLSALTSLVRDQLPVELEPDDSLVIFCAGHGDTVSSNVPDPQNAGKTVTRRTGYLIPVEAHESKPGDWLRLDAFLDDISNLPARHVLVILDACQSGFALSDKFRFRGQGQGGTIAELAARVSRRVITSAMHDQKAMDGGGTGNSLFTETLIDAVENQGADRDGDGFITTTDLFAFVRQQVSDTADRVHHVRQTPDYGQLPGDGSGELVLSLRGDTYNRLRAEENLNVADHIYALGALSGDAGRYASAIRHYRAAIDLAALGKMQLPAADLGLGKAFLAAGQADQAAGVLAGLVRTRGGNAPVEAQFWLGLAHAKRDEYAQASEALRAWQGLNPDSLDAAWVGAYVDWLGRAARPSGVRRLALLVGINQYRHPGASQLGGCVNDVEKLMGPALVAHGGFREQDVTILTDSQATRARFEEEFKRLQASATPSDAVLVHFSGHAAEVDQRGIFGKNDVENIYLLLHDTSAEPGYLTNGITADGLHQLMQDIPAGRKTLILDTHPSERLIELARREGSYALILASDTAEIASEWHVDVAGEDVGCGMLTAALCQSLGECDGQTLTYGEWMTGANLIVERATWNRKQYPRRQTPYFSGTRNQRVFAPDDVFLSAFQFSQRQEWPECPLDELTRLYAAFRHGVTVPHPHGHDAFGRAFLAKGAGEQAVRALQTAVAQAGDALPASLFHLARAQFYAGQYAGALATIRRYAPLAMPEDQDTVGELAGLLEKLAATRKHALLVGIDSYLSQEIPQSKGARNDVAAIERLLVQHWGFGAGDIVELLDAEATRACILAEFERLAELARHEPALFFFAGCGSRDEARLPTIVPYDARQADVPDIALEELAGLAGKDAVNLTVILDTSFRQHTLGTARSVMPGRRADDSAARFVAQESAQARLDALHLGAVAIHESLKPVGGRHHGISHTRTTT